MGDFYHWAWDLIRTLGMLEQQPDYQIILNWQFGNQQLIEFCWLLQKQSSPNRVGLRAPLYQMTLPSTHLSKLPSTPNIAFPVVEYFITRTELANFSCRTIYANDLWWRSWGNITASFMISCQNVSFIDRPKIQIFKLRVISTLFDYFVDLVRSFCG